MDSKGKVESKHSFAGRNFLLPVVEVFMRNSESRTSTVRPVGNMIAVWILIGGIVGGMGKVGVIAGAVGGMIVCSVIGIVGGLIGGDAVGTVIGASSLGIAAISGAPIGLPFGIMFGGLVGATIRPWIRISHRLLLGLRFISHSLALRLNRLNTPQQPGSARTESSVSTTLRTHFWLWRPRVAEAAPLFNFRIHANRHVPDA